jgi:predicted metal-dependent HD superfamily phosphohydrolase
VNLLDEWEATLLRCGASGDIRGTGERLLRRWAEPHRRYHDLRHLTAVLRHVDALAWLASDADAVRLAAWYHDAVYEGGEADEEASAGLAAAELPALGLSPGTVAEVVRLVELTASHDPAVDDGNGAVLCDADLAVLASPPREYDAYTDAVRAEYRHVPDRVFRATRARLLGSLLDRPALFRTPYARRRWEAAARANVSHELARLLPGTPGMSASMTAVPEYTQRQRDEDEALETGEAFQDAEGRRTTDPAKAAEHADSEADRTAERLERGEVGPGIPEE